ncbi:MAG TPA: cation:proton antiporter [Nocardioidaceae bacterium]|nr:cation:proton antiporter [Nocardioidaceae bacterium]
MTLDVMLAAVGALGVLVAALSARIRRLPVSEPLLGLLAGVLLGPAVLGALDLPPVTRDHATLHEVAELLLAVSVMGVALRYPFVDVRRRLTPVVVLLVVAMPLMALVTTGLAAGVLGLSVTAALLLGTALSPTDPVLASSVVTGEAAERDLPERARQVLSLESGANDGLALPLVLVALAFAGPMTGTAAATETAWQVLGAVALGALAGGLGGRALRLGEEHGATAHGPMLLFTIVLAAAVLGLSGLLHLDGVLAVFAAGLAFNFVSTGRERTSEVEIDEAVNRFAVLPMFVLVGATIPWAAWGDLGWAGPALVVAVLLLRRLPVLLLLKRPLRMSWSEAAYLGWFGPVGVAAVFYLTLEAKRLGLPTEVLAAGTMVVVASTVAHGVTAAPGRMLYRRLSPGARESAAAEQG